MSGLIVIACAVVIVLAFVIGYCDGARAELRRGGVSMAGLEASMLEKADEARRRGDHDEAATWEVAREMASRARRRLLFEHFGLGRRTP